MGPLLALALCLANLGLSPERERPPRRCPEEGTASAEIKLFQALLELIVTKPHRSYEAKLRAKKGSYTVVVVVVVVVIEEDVVPRSPSLSVTRKIFVCRASLTVLLCVRFVLSVPRFHRLEDSFC